MSASTFNLSIGRSIGHRMLVVLGVVLALALAGTGIGIWALSHIQQDTKELVDSSVATERYASDWHRLINAGVLRTTSIAVSADSSLTEFFAADTAESSRLSSALQKSIEAMMETPDEKKMFAEIGVRRTAYVQARDHIIATRKAGDAAAVKVLYASEFKPAADAYLGGLKALLDYQRDEIDHLSADLVKLNERARLGLIVFAVAAVGLGMVLSYWLANSITRPIRAAAHAADAIANFDLTSRVEGHDRDEAGRLLQSLAHMQGALRDLVDQVRNATQNVSTASGEIASGNQDLSQRTEQTASSLQHTAASMTQLTGTVRQTADAARSADQLAASASQAASKGGAVVAQVVTTMSDIDASSKRIADIIGVIDGIAFQTNILALNAAVEAARAGEQGRGFAVVASEVRSLAGRSAAAAKEIKQLIAASVDRVEAGTRLVEDAGASMSEIVTSVQRVTDIIAEISTAASEQSDGIGSVGAAVAQLDQMTQQNAALVEQSAAAATSLNEQAARLAQAVSVFKLQSAPGMRA